MASVCMALSSPLSVTSLGEVFVTVPAYCVPSRITTTACRPAVSCLAQETIRRVKIIRKIEAYPRISLSRLSTVFIISSPHCSTVHWHDACPQLLPDQHGLARQELLDTARGLACAVIVLNQREAHEALAQRAKADARRNRHLRLLHEQLGKLERTFLAMRFRYRGPHEH